MVEIGFHASHEQIPAAQLLQHVKHAETAGFDSAMCSDHFSPWSHDQGNSGFAWAWLGAAMEATSLPFGVVTAPGYRYHPAVLAQGAATLASMYPDRFWVALGSGEYVNEQVTGKPWPVKEKRQQNLEKNFELFRELFDGLRVSKTIGETYVQDARIWEQPSTKPKLMLPALTASTAQRFAAIADGLITVNQSTSDLKVMLETYREHGGKGPAILQVHLSWAQSQEVAESIAVEQWRTNVLPSPLMADLRSPEEFESHAVNTSPNDLIDSVVMSADLDHHADVLNCYRELGFDKIFLHHVGKDQSQFIDNFGQYVLPQLRNS